MTDREMFQKTFEKLHASPEVLTEVLDMTTDKNKITSIKKRRLTPKVAAAVAALVLAVGSGSVAYAMDIGGIQRKVQVWVHGDQTDAIFTVKNGSYTLDYKDKDGKDVQQSGGGGAMDADGTERPLTEEELWDDVNAPEVIYEDDGKVYVYYLNQKMDITDKFEDGICYVQLKVDGDTRYMTVKYQNGYALSPNGYISPDEFN